MMNEITSRFDLPSGPARKEHDTGDASKFQLALNEDKSGTSSTSSTNGTGATQLSQSQVTAPKSANRPELEKIANDPTVSAAIDKAWTASNPNGPGAKKEHGFWVIKDDKTGALSTKPFPDNGTNDSMTP